MATPDNLRKAMRPYLTAQANLDATRERAYAAIRKAHASGMSVREIAGVTGLSHQRIFQIVSERKEN